MQNLHKRQMQLALERGEFAASLVKKKDILEQERLRIMDDLRKIKKGEYGSIRKNAAGVMVASKILGNQSYPLNEERNLPSQARKLREKLSEDYERLDKLKRQHEETVNGGEKQQNMPDPGRELFNPEVVPMSPSYSNPALNAPIPARNNNNRFVAEIENLRNQSTPQYKPRQATPQIESPSPQAPAPVNPYTYPNQFNQTPPYGFNPYMMPQPNPYGGYPQYPQFYPPYPPPYPQFSPQQPPGEDPEAKALLRKIKKLKQKMQEPQNDQFYNNLQEGLRAIQNKIAGNETKPQENYRMAQELLPEERALKNVMQQEQNELKLLAALPKGSELYQAKLEHYKEMTQIRMRMEAMLQELSLNRMKKNFERDMDLEDKKMQNEK